MNKGLHGSLQLHPTPQHITIKDHNFSLSPAKLILIHSSEPGDLLFTARRAQSAVRSRGVNWEIVASPAVPAEQIGLVLHLDESFRPGDEQAYRLMIAPEGISITSAGKPGLFYGVCTLLQIVEQNGDVLPGLIVEDYPDFPARGVMLDVSRNRVHRLDTLFGLIDLLASWKINQLQLYTQHTFAYRGHPEVWKDASPYTGEDILEIDRYCRERFIELVPNQNSFGHLEDWLNLPAYASLAETHEPWSTPWNTTFPGAFSLCPGDSGSIALISSLYDELLPHFTSRLFNVGLDETHDVGQGRSKDICAQLGAGKVYLDFLCKIYEQVKMRGHRMMFWGDIIVHYPELVPELPRDAIALEWGYEADHPFDRHGDAFAKAGLPFYVCPGTSSWTSIGGRVDNAVGNIRSAAENGLKHGAIGLLITDWGDLGHWQMLPVSYPGLCMGAGCAWAYQANRDVEISGILNRHVFQDPTGAAGRALIALGNIYQAPGVTVINGSALFWVLQLDLNEIKQYGVGVENVQATLDAIQYASELVDSAQINLPDAELLQREMRLTVRMLQHACDRWLLAIDGDGSQAAEKAKWLYQDMNGIIEEFCELWMLRSRPGGLASSLERLEQLRDSYRQAV
jgi:hypothetical protein